jgi:glutamate--cysteine ligase
VRDWTAEEVSALRAEVPRLALAATIRSRSVRDVARDMLAIARDGLRARGLGEERYLDPLDEIAASGVTLAERWLLRVEREWGGDVRPVLAAAEV